MCVLSVLPDYRNVGILSLDYWRGGCYVSFW
nr:MAG TPA: acetyltransferase domain containing protein [Caudoviricetes sp.]